METLESSNYGELVPKVGFLTVLAVFLLLFTNCGEHHKASEHLVEQHLDFVGNRNGGVIVLTNNTDRSASFSLNINDRFPVTDSMLMQAVRSISKELNVHETEAAWMYVSDNTFHVRPYTVENWIHEPSLFINSIGGGLCNNRASVLAGIWQMFGYEVRVTGLTGHVVPEVFCNGKWQMFDPDEKIYFCNSVGEVMSIDEIAGSVRTASELKDRICSTVFYAFPSVDTVAAGRYLGYILSTSDNYDVTDWHLSGNVVPSTMYQLPSNSSLLFVSNDGVHLNRIILRLSESSKGILDLPFVATQIVGDIDTENGMMSGSVSLENSLMPLKIQGCSARAEITFAVNGKLRNLKVGTNSVTVSSNINMQLSTESELPKVEHELAAYLFFDTIVQFERAALTAFPHYKAEDAQFMADLSAHYDQFNARALRNDRDTVSSVMLTCDSLITEFGSDFQTLLLSDQPKSVHYLFLAHTYRQNQHIRTLINDFR